MYAIRSYYVEDAWRGKTGHASFFAAFELAEPTAAELLLGYDGPFRLWIDGKPIHEGLSGPWPWMQDSLAVPVTLGAGRHEVAVTMATGSAAKPSTGFFMRMRAADGKKALGISLR